MTPSSSQPGNGRLAVFALLALLWLTWAASAAATPAVSEYNSRVWQVENGLPQNIVQAIVQTRDGYLWVGTQKGLARFDGIRFTIFNKTTTPALSGQFIASLCEGRDGSLWIGSNDGGVMRFQNGQFFSYGTAEGLDTNYVKAVCETTDGVLWIGTVNGLSRLRNGRIEPFSPRGAWLFNAVRSLVAGANGVLWVGTDRGVLLVQKDDFTFCDDKNRSAPNNAVRVVCPEGADTAWFGTLSYGLLQYDTTNHTGRLFTVEDGLLDNMVTALHRDRATNLWIGTYAGLCRYTHGRFITELTTERLAYNTVNAFCEDREGNLWVGSKDGLHQLTPRLFTTFTEADGLTRNNIISVREDKNGALWVGTWGGGLNRRQQGMFSALVPAGEASRQACNLVLSLNEGLAGRFWIGTDYAGGIFLHQNDHFVRYGPGEGLQDRPVRVLHEDRHGCLWLGTTTGLIAFQEGAFLRYTTADGLAGNTVRVICEDAEDGLWIGTSEGLSRWQDGVFESFTTQDGLSHNTISAIYQDREKNLWVGTSGGGLNRMKSTKLKTPKEKNAAHSPIQPAKTNSLFTAYTTKQGLFNDDVFEIVEDDYGYFWLTSRYGISRVRKKDFVALDQGELPTLRSITYGRRDGLLSTECNSVGKPAAWKSRDGRLWFATAKGLSTVMPTSDMRLNQLLPPVTIEALFVNRQKMADEKWQRQGEKNRTMSPLQILPGHRDFEFHYTALSLTEPGKNQFKYQLQGVDPEWIDAGTRRVAYYNNLAPGSYQFCVKACNNNGVWNEIGAVLPFTLLPHFWQAWWFKFAAILAGVGTITLLALHLARRSIQPHLRQLESQHLLDAERARIAKDLHDHLGASLTHIGLLSELARRHASQPEAVVTHTEKMSKMTLDVAKILDEIVWSVNPENDTVKRLAVYLVHYAEEFFETAAIRCRLDIPMELPEQPLPADIRHNLFSAVKESLNNIVKHSKASETWLRLAVHANTLEITIEDNGQGFNPAQTDPTRNGLKNLQQRLQAVQGYCEISSQPGHGTKIKFSVHLSDRRG